MLKNQIKSPQHNKLNKGLADITELGTTGEIKNPLVVRKSAKEWFVFMVVNGVMPGILTFSKRS